MLPEDLLKEANLTAWAYELVDELLRRMSQRREYSISFSLDTEIGNRAISLIKNESLAKCSSPLLRDTTFVITQKGRDVIAAGGIKNYMDFWGNGQSNTLNNSYMNHL